jgi:hypothetical protein
MVDTTLDVLIGYILGRIKTKVVCMAYTHDRCISRADDQLAVIKNGFPGFDSLGIRSQLWSVDTSPENHRRLL